MHFSRQTAHKLLAVLVAVAVLSFGFQAAGHWHSRTHEDQNCRVCHFAHSVTVDFSHGNASHRHDGCRADFGQRVPIECIQESLLRIAHDPHQEAARK